ncbi:MAG: response regulator [Sandaracinaceae bacterium]
MAKKKSDHKKPAYLSDRWRGPSSPRLLLVDDDEMMRRSSKRFLARAGFEVVAAKSGAEALELFEGERPFDVVVMDLEMPGMSGVELMRELARRKPGLPMGLWSASSLLRDLERKDLELAWFVKSKMAPIGSLVQAVCQAVYGQRTAYVRGGGDADESGANGSNGSNGHGHGNGSRSRSRYESEQPGATAISSYISTLRPLPVPEPVRLRA